MSKRRILVVEDDHAVREGLVDALDFEGYEVFEAATYEDAVRAGLSTDVHLVLLDLVLPGGDGLDVLQKIRGSRPTLPVIILTARGQEDDRVQGLKLGADDYVLKPFSLKELLARVEAVLRRSAERPSDVTTIELRGGSADLEKCVIGYDDGSKAELSEREVALLRYLVINAGRVITRDELLERVWRIPAAGVRTRTVDVHIGRLRDKLKDEDPNDPVIQTVRGKGYVFHPKEGTGWIRRPVFAYAIFAACLLLAGLGATLLSWTVLERDQAEARARREALREENTRLALWRIDSEISTLIATENARPYFDYAAFRSLTRAYTNMTNDLGKDERVEASPLLAARPKYVRLHFQFAGGTLSSPQVPGERFEANAASIVGRPALVEAKKQLAQLSSMLDEGALVAKMDAAQNQQIAQKPPPPPEPELYARTRSLKNSGEFWKRSQSVQQASTYNVGVNNGLVNPLVGARGDLEGRLAERSLTAVWIGDELLLARRVTVGSRSYLQGLWLDWPTMRAALRDSIEDLLPFAELEPLHDAPADESANLLASLPLRLNPGSLPFRTASTSLTTELSLVAVWMGFVVAGVAMLILVTGAISLSERRAAFVSAVTHELRTPLTTFRMYTEMLSEGRVKNDEKKKRYLDTLRREAVRLAHLVENVLAYSRIERGRAAAPPARTNIDDLLEPMLERLQDRAAQARMEIAYEPPEEELAVVADHSAVEHILFNLVDNACKYASSSKDKRIHIGAQSAGARVVVTVADHGPGIQGEERRTLFSPFSKSAQRAALSAPGVGLGLALSRRLAKEMGARLTYGDAPGGGACFRLSFGRG